MNRFKKIKIKSFLNFAVVSVASESSVPSSTDASLPDSVFLSGETQQQLLKLKRHVVDTQNQLKQIRRAAQVIAQKRLWN